MKIHSKICQLTLLEFNKEKMVPIKIEVTKMYFLRRNHPTEKEIP